MAEVIFFDTAQDFSDWLSQNGAGTTEVWVGFYKKTSGKTAMTYAEAVDQALCWGWIDGIRKGIDEVSYTNRFTPRTSRSTWSAVNMKRIEELTELGLMQPSGRKAYEARLADRQKIYAYENVERSTLDEAQEAELRANEAAWKFFSAQGLSYQKGAIWWVISAKKEETRRSRLATLIADSAAGRKIAYLNYVKKTEN